MGKLHEVQIWDSCTRSIASHCTWCTFPSGNKCLGMWLGYFLSLLIWFLNMKTYLKMQLGYIYEHAICTFKDNSPIVDILLSSPSTSDVHWWPFRSIWIHRQTLGSCCSFPREVQDYDAGDPLTSFTSDLKNMKKGLIGQLLPRVTLTGPSFSARVSWIT